MKKLNIVVIVFLLVGCCTKKSTMNFSLKIIPDGNVGRPYNLKLESSFVIYDIGSNNSELGNGLHLVVIYPTKEDGSSRGVFEIKGTPQHEGIAQLTIEGSTPGTSCTGQHFKKTFSVMILGKDLVLDVNKVVAADTKITTTCL